MKRLGILLGVCALFICKIALAQAPADFVHKASTAGWKEVKAGELAEKKGVSPRVKAFGEKMVKDHTMANDKLMVLAKKKGWTSACAMKSSVPGDAMLMKAQGKEFDRMYVSMMLNDHKEAVSLFEMEAKDTKDPELRMFAQNTLPKLKEHLEMIKSIATEMHLK